MTTIVTSRKERVRFFKFAIVGSLGAMVDFSIMNLLTGLLHFRLVPAGVCSFVCAVTSNYLGNRHWTYPESRSKPVTEQLITFFIVNIAGVLIRIPILQLGELPIQRFLSQINLPFLPVNVLARNATLAIAIGVVMLWNFFVNRYWTFNDVDNV